MTPQFVRDNLLSMNLSLLRFYKNDPHSIDGIATDYYTVFVFVLPDVPIQFLEGDFDFQHEALSYRISFHRIYDPTDDPIYQLGKDYSIGSNGTGIDQLPFYVFTDNRMQYPAWLISLVLPTRVAHWYDADHVTGIRQRTEDPREDIIGIANDEDKVNAIHIINCFLRSEQYGSQFPILNYNSFSNFIIAYKKKVNDEQVLLIQTMLSSGRAYQDAIFDYLQAIHIKSQILELSAQFALEKSSIVIKDESDLHSLILETVNKTIRHYIEDIRWTQPFWRRDDVDKLHPMDETQIQPTLFVLFQILLRPLGVTVSREVHVGAGELDYKFSYTTISGEALCVLMELKLAHGSVKHGITNQLPAYMKAEMSNHSIFVQLWFKDSKEKYFDKPPTHTRESAVTWLEGLAEKTSKANGNIISAITIDASIRNSASTI